MTSFYYFGIISDKISPINSFGKGCWKVSNMEPLCALEAKKLTKEKCKQ